MNVKQHFNAYKSINAIQNNKTTFSEIKNLNFMHVIMFQVQSDFSHEVSD